MKTFVQVFDRKSYQENGAPTDQGKWLLQPIPHIHLNARCHFGCLKGRRTRDQAVEKVLRFIGPGQTWDIDEAKSRLFGYVDDDTYSRNRIASEPRPYWTLHIYEMEADGTLKLEKRDVWDALKDFYGTDDLRAMTRRNSWADQKAVP
jgi:hypothetical protein